MGYYPGDYRFYLNMELLRNDLKTIIQTTIIKCMKEAGNTKFKTRRPKTKNVTCGLGPMW